MKRSELKKIIKEEVKVVKKDTKIDKLAKDLLTKYYDTAPDDSAEARNLIDLVKFVITNMNDNPKPKDDGYRDYEYSSMSGIKGDPNKF